jgi:hypothetical protein
VAVDSLREEAVLLMTISERPTILSAEYSAK